MGLLYLTCGEQQQAYFAAREHFRSEGQPVDPAAAAQFDFEHGYQLCALMLLERKDPERKLFRSVKEVRLHLTPNEIDYFLQAHMQLQMEEATRWKRRLSPELSALAEIFHLEAENATPEAIIEAAREVWNDLHGDPTA